jgi:hypothetical protein
MIISAFDVKVDGRLCSSGSKDEGRTQARKIFKDE